MAIRRRRANNIVKLNNRITTDRSAGTRLVTETWVGPYDQLLIKQQAVESLASSTDLLPGDADTGILTITTATAPANPNPGTGSNETIEVEWVELRKKLEDHPRYSAIDDNDRRKIRAAINNPNPDQSPAISGLALDLYLKLLRGQTDYSLAVPVIRRTSTGFVQISSGGAWFRQSPPISVGGAWQFLKTADRILIQGRTFTRVEEWTGAEEWDADIYP